MKALFLIENLQKKLPYLSHAISGRSQLPILNNFLIQAKKGKITISATDLEIGIISSFPASVEEEGEITVPAKTFSDFILSVNDEKVELSFKDGNLRLKGLKFEANLQTSSSDEYPKIIEEKGEKIGVFKRGTIEKEFQRVVFSASQDQGRANLSGLLIKKAGKTFSLVATDGYRLSLKNNFMISGGEVDIEEILAPSRIIRELLSMKNEPGDIEMFVSKKTNQIIFVYGESMLAGRLIEANYPDYGKIIPSGFSTKAEFSREELLRAVKTCAVFARETANIVKFSITKEKLVVSANTPSVGDDKVEIPVKTEGDENEIAFNARYLLDLLSAIEDDEMTFEMSGSLSSGVFRLKNEPSYLHLIMPIRIQG